MRTYRVQNPSYNICKVEAADDEIGSDITNGFRRGREEGITMGYYQKKKVEVTDVLDNIEGELDDGESEDGDEGELESENDDD
ncbi:hypothetical protein L2E82_22970 [Cichorium intybus]|uniref:Uncharacterized protein n=1 Tax=Cichorium intybus TaxID=13427 RepID=A0ACB9DZ12_CICIN|nr:hypothetical protein L2E82_22970 [Cichorium intybus]